MECASSPPCYAEVGRVTYNTCGDEPSLTIATSLHGSSPVVFTGKIRYHLAVAVAPHAFTKVAGLLYAEDVKSALRARDVNPAAAAWGGGVGDLPPIFRSTRRLNLF